MKVKVDELSGVALDYAVATLVDIENLSSDGISWIIEGKDFYKQLPKYSTDWGQGGPIIEREGIDMYCNIPQSIAETVKQSGWDTDWRAAYSRCGVGTIPVHGRTPLIAAMRCYVAHKFGKEIEVPDELEVNS